MARKAGGQEVLEAAKVALTQARTVDELRQAQAVVFPLAYGLSLEQTAEAMGVSPGWVCRLRNRFIRGDSSLTPTGATVGGRRRSNLSREEELVFVQPYLDKIKQGKPLVVSEVKAALEKRLGRSVALASAYNLLHRHGWQRNGQKQHEA